MSCFYDEMLKIDLKNMAPQMINLFLPEVCKTRGTTISALGQNDLSVKRLFEFDLNAIHQYSQPHV